MSEQDHPGIYLISPTDFSLSVFAEQLAGILDTFEIPCVRLRGFSDDADTIARAADVLREICHQREVPIVIDNHYRIAQSHGLDGVHLTTGTKHLRDLRKELGADAIIGSYCGDSRHTGITAGEIGADYVSFGPVTQSPLASDQIAAFDTFEWWSEMINLPVVAEGFVTLEAAEKLAPVTDFFALGAEIWNAGTDPETTLRDYLKRIS